MRPKLNPDSVAEEALLKHLRRGVDSDVLVARLDWAEAEAIARYVRPLEREARVKPNVLPTAQSQGRWSTTKRGKGEHPLGAPIVTWPDHDPNDCVECKARGGANGWCPRAVREIIVPDPGTWWLKGDADAIEARIAAAYTRDEAELEAFKRGWDIHTLTACGMFDLPLPPVKVKTVIHHGPCNCKGDHVCQWVGGPGLPTFREDGTVASWGPGPMRQQLASGHHPHCPEGWREQVKWGGESDTRRGVGKAFKYAWQYGLDERAVLLQKDIIRLGLEPEKVLEFARAYKRAKPGFFAGRRQWMETCARHREARTFLGRLRRLYGKPRDMMKEGWSHMVSGSVSDITNMTFIAWTQRFPESWLVLNAYDSLTMGFPGNLDPAEVVPQVQALTERDWEIEGTVIRLPWTWKVIQAV